MKEKAHFNPKAVQWIVSLAVMILVAAAVVVISNAVYSAVNKKYNEPVEVGFTIAFTESVDISSMNAQDYNVAAVEAAYDENGDLAAYIVETTAVGYNTESPIEMTSVISADGTLVCGIDILHQDETEYLGAKITTSAFQDQFTGRYLPVMLSGSTEKGSSIDSLSKATISSQAVIDSVNNAYYFVAENLAAAE